MIVEVLPSEMRSPSIFICPDWRARRRVMLTMPLYKPCFWSKAPLTIRKNSKVDGDYTE
jgi:hypothetical protein